MTQEESSSSSWHQEVLEAMLLPAKFNFVSTPQKVHNPKGRCLLEPDNPYLIEKIEIIGLGVLFHLVCPLGNRYCLPEQYAKVVSDDDIHAVNMG
jgi:hypothetical protein